MLIDSDNSGISTFFMGIIVLVMAGTGLSFLVNKRFSYSKTASNLDGLIQVNRVTIEDLKTLQIELETRLASSPKIRSGSNLENIETPHGAGRQDLVRETLLDERTSLHSEISAILDQFVCYRDRYRKFEWSSASGQFLGDLETRSGRKYTKVVISRVTEVGLEIRHENGVGRIHFSDLAESLRDRFQWEDDQRIKRFEKEDSFSRRVTPHGRVHD